MTMGILLIMFALIATIVSGWQYWTIAISEKQQKRKTKNGYLPNFASARRGFYVMTGLVSLASAFLLYLILSHHFQVDYVYRYSSMDLPFGYLISSFWAGQEGSFLLWALLIALMGLVFIKTAGQFEAVAMLVINGVLVFFLAILLKASPFELLSQTPPDGAGLNPLLQNPWMVIHPPMLFVGYAAAAFPFALAIAALIRREYSAFIAKALPWTVFTSLTLGAGIIIGGYWAYKVLGWGEYWGWDPVENSSLVPWLTTLALIHGLLVQRKTGALPRVNFLLTIFTFALVIYATFLTRSGVLADFSVHSFQDLGINLYLVMFIMAILVTGVTVLRSRHQHIQFQELNLTTLNREAILLSSMLVFSLSAFLTFIGTSSPLFTGLVGKPAQVDTSFYNIVHIPIGIALALFLGFAPYLRWESTNNLLKTLLPSLIFTIVSTAVAFWFGMTEITKLTFTAAAAFAFWSNLFVTVKLFRINWLISGAPLSHVGVALLLIGIIVSATFDTAQQFVLERGVPVQVMDHQLLYQGVTPAVNGKNVVNIRVSSEGGNYIAQPRFYYSEYNRSTMREPDVKAGLLGDIYISPIEIRNTAQTASNAQVLRLTKGETKQFKDMQITFDQFEIGEHAGSNQMKVGARLTINSGENTFHAIPAVIFDGGQNRSENAEILFNQAGKQQKITVILNGLDANQKTIELQLEGLNENSLPITEAKELLIIEISRKPFMSVLWIGTIIITLGAIIALLNRMSPPVNLTKNNKEHYHDTIKKVSELSN